MAEQYVSTRRSRGPQLGLGVLKLGLLGLSVLVLSLSACTRASELPELTEVPGALAGDGGVDDLSSGSAGGSPIDSYDAGIENYEDALPVDLCSPSCGDVELCGETGDGDGVDNDCDGVVDEDCACAAAGITRECFRGPPDRRNVGSCSDGVMVCTEFLTWSTCEHGVFPAEEVCDGADNDCSGIPDDGLEGCDPALVCPGSQTAAPLNQYPLQGSRMFAGEARSARWTIECPASVHPCPMVEDPSALDTSIYFLSSGSYRATLQIETADGEELSCGWVINVQGAGLRVELNWDTRGKGNGDTDLDLHLHRRTVAPHVMTGESDFFTSDDCYYGNCKGSSYQGAVRTQWSLPDTREMSVCEDAPQGQGRRWRSRGACYNPRLDVDVVYCDPEVTDPTDSEFCAPENVNIDTPPDGATYRIMVNYYSDHRLSSTPPEATHPTVSIFCGGEMRGTFGDDASIALRNGAGMGRTNDSWLVADVKFVTDACGRVECMVQPLGIVQRGTHFGPPWSF